MAALQNDDAYIGQLLLKDGIITSQELERGLLEQKKDNDFLCSTIVRLGFASEEKIYSMLSLQIGVPFLSLENISIDSDILEKIPGSFALASLCLPLKMTGHIFYVVMADPLNVEVVDEIKTCVGTSDVRIFLSGENAIRRAIKRYYGIGYS